MFVLNWIIALFCHLLIAESCEVSQAEWSPFELKVTTINYVQHLSWKAIKGCDATAGNTPAYNFTVYKLHIDISYECRDCPSLQRWSVVQGCEHVRSLGCIVQERLDFNTDYTLWVTSRGENTSVRREEIDTKQLLDFIPFEGNLTFTTPEVKIQRESHKIHLSCVLPTLPWSSNYSIARFGVDENIDQLYYIEYYGYKKLDDNVTKTVSIQHKKVEVTSSNITIVTSLSENMIICVRVQLWYEEFAENIKSPFTKHCIDPAETPQHSQQIGTHHIIWLVVSGVMLLLLVVVLAKISRTNFRSLYTRAFNIKTINIEPHLYTEQIDYWKNTKTGNSPVCDVSEVVDVITPNTYTDNYHPEEKLIQKLDPKIGEKMCRTGSSVLLSDAENPPYLRKYSSMDFGFISLDAASSYESLMMPECIHQDDFHCCTDTEDDLHDNETSTGSQNPIVEDPCPATRYVTIECVCVAPSCEKENAGRSRLDSAFYDDESCSKHTQSSLQQVN